MYVDDVVLQCPRDMFATTIEAFNAAMTQHKLKLQPAKSAAHVPAWASMDEWPEDAAGLWGGRYPFGGMRNEHSPPRVRIQPTGTLSGGASPPGDPLRA